MSDKRKNIYLYLALACFLGIILIFVFDGYMGAYETLEMDNGEYVQTVTMGETSDNGRPYSLAYFNVERDGTVKCTYIVENRRFTGFNEPLRVTIEAGGTEALVYEGLLKTGAFSKTEASWEVETAGLVLEEPDNVVNNYTLVMNVLRGDAEHRIQISINNANSLIKIPVPVAE